MKWKIGLVGDSCYPIWLARSNSDLIFVLLFKQIIIVSCQLTHLLLHLMSSTTTFSTSSQLLLCFVDNICCHGWYLWSSGFSGVLFSWHNCSFFVCLSTMCSIDYYDHGFISFLHLLLLLFCKIAFFWFLILRTRVTRTRLS